MSNKKLKAVFIVGPDIDSLPKSIFEQYSKPGFLLIGDGKKDISVDDYNALQGQIDENTRIDIFAHGKISNNQHVLQLFAIEGITTNYMLTSLNYLGNNSPLHIHLWSCYAGFASKDVSYLANGSLLVTHGL